MTKTIVPTNIKKLREKNGFSLFRLAEGVSATLDEMGKIENGDVPLSADQLAKLAAILKVKSYEVIGLPIDEETAAAFDDAQLSYTIGWLLEASYAAGIEMTPEILARWVIHICTSSLQNKLNFKQNRDLAYRTVAEIKNGKGNKDSAASM